MKDKLLDFLKSKWKEGVIFVLVGVASTFVYKWIDASVTITAYKNQEKSLKEIIKTLERTKAKEKVVYKYVKGDVVEKIVYRDLVIEKDIDRNTRSESKVVLPKSHKLWSVGVFYDVPTQNIGAEVTHTFFNLVYVGASYPMVFDGVNRVQVSAGLRF